MNLTLNRGHIDMIESVVKYCNTHNLTDMAQLTLDVNLRRYVWRTETYPSPDIFQRLLNLGARPEWKDERGNTIFHATKSTDLASTLLDFSSPPIDSQNYLGHTLLMVLSWFLEVDLVRKLLATGVLIHTQDHAGWTVPENLFRANSSRFSRVFCSRQCTAV